MTIGSNVLYALKNLALATNTHTKKKKEFCFKMGVSDQGDRLIKGMNRLEEGGQDKATVDPNKDGQKVVPLLWTLNIT